MENDARSEESQPSVGKSRRTKKASCRSLNFQLVSSINESIVEAINEDSASQYSLQSQISRADLQSIRVEDMDAEEDKVEEENHGAVSARDDHAQDRANKLLKEIS